MVPVFFREGSEFLNWLEINHSHEKELWLGFLKKQKGQTPGFTYPEAVEIALCYGWIDGKTMSVDDKTYKIRFTPRRADSVWSNINIKRVEELMKAGLMQPSGIAIFEKRNLKKNYNYTADRANATLSKEFEAELKAHPKAYSFFMSRSNSYRNTSIYWIIRAKQEATRERRLRILIDCCEEGIKIPLLRTNSEKK